MLDSTYFLELYYWLNGFFFYDYNFLIAILISVVVSLLFAHFRPYKNNYFNIIDSLGFALSALLALLIMYAMHNRHIPIQLLQLILLIPFLYFISFILYKIFSRVAPFRSCCRKIGVKFRARHLHTQRGDNIDEDLPDRIVNPDMYQPLLPPTSAGDEYSRSDCEPQASLVAGLWFNVEFSHVNFMHCSSCVLAIAELSVHLYLLSVQCAVSFVNSPNTSF